MAPQRNPDLQGSCSLATHRSLSVRSEQNSSKLRHAARDVYRRPSAFSRVHCVTRLKGVRRERINKLTDASCAWYIDPRKLFTQLAPTLYHILREPHSTHNQY
jgi:hypothetical protein